MVPDRPDRSTWLVGCTLLTTAFLAGCIGPVAPAPVIDRPEVFVLDYTITALDDEPRNADSGHHCGDVRIEKDTMTIWLWPDEEEPPDPPMLVVYSRIPDHWSSTGSLPFKTSLPATLDPVRDDTAIANVAWETHGAHNGTLYVNGDAVEPPYAWSVTGEDRTWKADAKLTTWTGGLDFDRYEGGCM